MRECEVNLEMPKGLYDGVRASDLRFDNLHILAEYVSRAQRFADSAMQIEASAARLVQEGIRTTEEGVRQFKAALREMQFALDTLQRQVGAIVNATGIDISKAVADAHMAGASYILQAGEIAKLSYEGLVSRAGEVGIAAERLEQAAAKAESNRWLAYDQLEQLQAFKSELTKFERASLARLTDANAKLYQGVGVWQRICYVMHPPVPVVQEIKRPIRSTTGS